MRDNAAGGGAAGAGPPQQGSAPRGKAATTAADEMPVPQGARKRDAAATPAPPSGGSAGTAAVKRDAAAARTAAALPEPRQGEAEPEREAREAVAAAPPADQMLRSGLQLAFRVNPADAFVLLDGTVIGSAEEWSGEKKGRSYTLPGPGSYLLKIKKQGMKDYRIAVEATASRGVTPVTVRLQPLPAAQVDAADLHTVRVRDAIALRVQPEAALVLVDGQPRGMARQYAGRFGRPGEWLTLEPGKHRVTVTAPGYRRQDIAVEVSPGADKDRERVDITLAPGAGGE